MQKKQVVTHIVVFKDSDDKHAQPEMFTCSAAEAGEIRELLDRVCNQGMGPIDSLSYTEFVEKVGTITLKKLQKRFAGELSKLEAEEADEDA